MTKHILQWHAISGTSKYDPIARAKELIQTAKHASMATVNEDGSPHNTPFYLILDDDLRRIYFGSHPDALHSQNIIRTGEFFVVVYDMLELGGLYIKAGNSEQLSGANLDHGLTTHNAKRARNGKTPLAREFYEGDSPQRMFGADITNLWVNHGKKDAHGHIVRDYRTEIEPADLLTHGQ